MNKQAPIINDQWNARGQRSVGKHRGFTLVETLVAIAILMIAIAGPLTVATQALTAAVGARDTMIASYLAQDGMEAIKNIKDNNISVDPATWANGLYSIGNCSADTDMNSRCATPDVVGLVGSGLGAGTMNPCAFYSNCVLYSNPNPIGPAGYYYIGGASLSDVKTHFTRYYYFSNAGTNDGVVTVVVQWKQGSVSNEIRLKELMTNTPR